MTKALRAFMTLTFAFLITTAMAVSASASGPTFTVKANLPEDQDPRATYFQFPVEPGQVRELSIDIENRSDNAITLDVEIHPATTDRSGGLYFGEEGIIDESLKINLSDIAVLPNKQVTIPARETMTVPFTLNVPSEPFEGKVHGAIKVIQAGNVTAENETDGAGQAGTSISNRYAFEIGIVLYESEATIPPDFRMDEVRFELYNYTATIMSCIRNPVPAIINEAKISGAIYEKDNLSEPVITREVESVLMAANSVFQLVMMDEAGYGFLPGEYVSKVTVEYGGEVWNLEKEFEILPEEAAYVNENALNQQRQQRLDGNAESEEGLPAWVLITLISIGIILLIALIIFILIMSKINRENKEYVLQQQQKLSELTQEGNKV